MFKNILSYLSDCLWVAVMLVRGKVLRQKAYRLEAGVISVIRGTTARRMTMLMGWWGLRPATLDELKRELDNMDFPPVVSEQVSSQMQKHGYRPATPKEICRFQNKVPNLRWDGKKWQLESNWNDDDRFFCLRK